MPALDRDEAALSVADGLDRRHTVDLIRRINDALVTWDMWEWNQSAPEPFRQQLTRPRLARAELQALRRHLLRQLHTLPAAA